MILAIDTGVRTFGWALVDPDDEMVHALGAQCTEPLFNERVHESYVRRMLHQVSVHRSHLDMVSVIVGEELSFPRSAKAIASVSMCWGALCALAAVEGIPIEAVAPKHWQQAFQVSKSKVDYAQVTRAVRLHLEMNSSAGAKAQLHALKAGERPHAVDACGVGIYRAKLAAARKRRGSA